VTITIQFEFVLQTAVCDAVVYHLDINKGDYKAIKAAMKDINWYEEL